MALDVTLAVLSELLCDWSSVLEELLRAVTQGFLANQFPLMAVMCLLLLPQGKVHLH